MAKSGSAYAGRRQKRGPELATPIPQSRTHEVEITNDAGEVIASPTIDSTIRTGLAIAGLLVLAAWGLYRLAAPQLQGETDDHVAEVPSD